MCCFGIWAVVRLGIAEARVLVAGGLPMGFFDPWWLIVAEAVGGFHRLEVADIGGVGLVYAVEVVAMGGACFGDAAAQMKALTSVLAGEGSRQCTRAPQLLLFLC
jgi:hypothetical protein